MLIDVIVIDEYPVYDCYFNDSLIVFNNLTIVNFKFYSPIRLKITNQQFDKFCKKTKFEISLPQLFEAMLPLIPPEEIYRLRLQTQMTADDLLLQAISSIPNSF